MYGRFVVVAVLVDVDDRLAEVRARLLRALLDLRHGVGQPVAVRVQHVADRLHLKQNAKTRNEIDDN